MSETKHRKLPVRIVYNFEEEEAIVNDVAYHLADVPAKAIRALALIGMASRLHIARHPAELMLQYMAGHVRKEKPEVPLSELGQALARIWAEQDAAESYVLGMKRDAREALVQKALPNAEATVRNLSSADLKRLLATRDVVTKHAAMFLPTLADLSSPAATPEAAPDAPEPLETDDLSEAAE